ncbi:MAG: hypothetical protein ABUL62_18010 [Myxococcales bacterium]
MPSSSLPSPHAWLVRLCTMTAFVLCLGWAASASAAVPMCGARGQSIAAPPIGTPTSDAALSGGAPCEQAGPLRAVGVPQREAPQQLSFYELPIRALPTLPRIAPCPVTARVSPAAAETELIATGFARSIERPPRA